MQVQAKITSKNQITIPKVIREVLKLKKTDKKLIFNVNRNHSITIEKPHKNTIWQIVARQEKKYGSIDTPEIDWGEDVGEERIH